MIFSEEDLGPAPWKNGDRAIHLPSNVEVIVHKQLVGYDYPEVFWGNVVVYPVDPSIGTINDKITCHNWQLQKKE